MVLFWIYVMFYSFICWSKLSYLEWKSVKFLYHQGKFCALEACCSWIWSAQGYIHRIQCERPLSTFWRLLQQAVPLHWAGTGQMVVGKLPAASLSPITLASPCLEGNFSWAPSGAMQIQEKVRFFRNQPRGSEKMLIPDQEILACFRSECAQHLSHGRISSVINPWMVLSTYYNFGLN